MKNENRKKNRSKMLLNKKIFLHRGPKSYSHKFEDKLVEYIRYNRKNGKSVTPFSIIHRYLQMNSSDLNKALNAHLKWCYQFFKNNGLSLRLASHIV